MYVFKTPFCRFKSHSYSYLANFWRYKTARRLQAMPMSIDTSTKSVDRHSFPLILPTLYGFQSMSICVFDAPFRKFYLLIFFSIFSRATLVLLGWAMHLYNAVPSSHWFFEYDVIPGWIFTFYYRIAFTHFRKEFVLEFWFIF
jgi:hypothetical protein